MSALLESTNFPRRSGYSRLENPNNERVAKRSDSYQTPLSILLALNMILLIGNGILLSRHGNVVAVKDFFPRIPITDVTFQKDDSFEQSLPRPYRGEIDRDDSPWSKIMPIGGGYVVVPDPAMWNLSGGIPFPNSPEAGAESYCVSMFHQLHCISALKIALAKATGHMTGQRDLPSEDEYDHLLHCNDYLRQSIICAGDTTLEKAKVHSEKRLGVDGMGVSHRCRDWNTIFKFVEDNSPQRFDPKKIQ
ncbi:uncharacterized protein K444DRAFT_385420 [Hyaloscypha bicolor E]|uniref:Uncharacterized protein n=1 Tax=Hyaloscypha bicolor E TaxID=1095630 RepID=A0A2J6TDG4_9HELO|nr:uncharacterized protein K444DRAFT_385420 [Hyaloscypha bicolor E]PMD61033.1 hypothetical protein K444DRAFT_385420 [Hyaloscypha bicolor E]